MRFHRAAIFSGSVMDSYRIVSSALEDIEMSSWRKMPSQTEHIHEHAHLLLTMKQWNQNKTCMENDCKNCSFRQTTNAKFVHHSELFSNKMLCLDLKLRNTRRWHHRAHFDRYGTQGRNNFSQRTLDIGAENSTLLPLMCSCTRPRTLSSQELRTSCDVLPRFAMPAHFSTRLFQSEAIFAAIFTLTSNWPHVVSSEETREWIFLRAKPTHSHHPLASQEVYPHHVSLRVCCRFVRLESGYEHTHTHISSCMHH